MLNIYTRTYIRLIGRNAASRLRRVYTAAAFGARVHSEQCVLYSRHAFKRKVKLPTAFAGMLLLCLCLHGRVNFTPVFGFQTSCCMLHTIHTSDRPRSTSILVLRSKIDNS